MTRKRASDISASDLGADDHEARLARVAAAIAEPARSRMLCSLLDDHARTATELAVVAGVGASTASAHLLRMKELGLLRLAAQGRHRYYALAGSEVARALEALLVVAMPSAPLPPFVPGTPPPLRLARSCYDHVAGELGVAWHDRLLALGWLGADAVDYRLTPTGKEALAALGVSPEHTRRRRLAYPCLDWSVRRPHLGGALGAALLELGLARGWLRRQPDSRALDVTAKGWRQLDALFGLRLESLDQPSAARLKATSG